MIICLGPFCIPAWGLLPFLGAIIMQFKGWLMSRLRGNNTNGTTATSKSIDDGKVGEDKTIVIMGNFDEILQKYNLVFIDFGAEWCGGCKKLAPVFHKLASLESNPPDVGFLSVDIDENQDIADRYEVGALPSFLVVRRDGTQVAGGPIGKESKLVEFVQENLDLHVKQNLTGKKQI